VNHKELWFVPSAGQGSQWSPFALHTFELLTTGVVAAGPDVFYISISDFYTWRSSTTLTRNHLEPNRKRRRKVFRMPVD
jgi:hypothetical protein